MPNKRKRKNIRIKNYIPQWVYRVARLWGTLKQHLSYYSRLSKKEFWIGIVTGFLRAPLDAGKILVSGLLVDSIVDYYDNQTSLDFFGIHVPMPVFYVIGIVIFARSSTLLKSRSTIAKIRLHNYALKAYRKTVSEKFHKLNSQEIDQEHVKDLITKINTYWSSNAKSLYDDITMMGGYVLSILIAFSTLFAVSPLVALLVLLVPEIEIFAQHRYFRRRSRYVDDIAPLLLERNYLYSTLTNARTFAERKVNRVYKTLINRYENRAEVISKGYIHVNVTGERRSMIANLADHFIFTIMKVVIVVTEMAKRTAVGHITYLLGYAESLYSNSFDLQQKIITMYDELSFVEFLHEFLETEGFADDTKRGKRLKKIPPKIELKDVDFHYLGSNKKILDNASFTIAPKDKVLIFGRDGSGKSSLLALLAGMYAIQKGDIKYNGVPIKSLARGEAKRHMSVISEDFARFYMTLKENVLLGDPSKKFDEKLYKKALEITGLDTWAKEENLDDEKTILGNYFEGSMAISSGHWQRIAIARAIYRNKEIFLFDQPFTYIDHEATEEMVPRLMKYLSKKTVVFISENMHHAKYFDKIYRLEEKKLNLVS